MKELSLQGVDLIFYEEIEIEYEGMYFSLFSSSIKPENVEERKFVIFTDSKEAAQQYAFEKKIQKPIKEYASSICENIIIENFWDWFRDAINEMIEEIGNG